MTRLPDQWSLARVGDLIDVDPRTDCSDDLDVGFVPLARLGAHYRSRPSFETRQWAMVKQGYTHFRDGDVLLARITPSFENGKAGIPRGLPKGLGAGSTEYIVCRPDPACLLPEYLLAHFKTPTFLRRGASVMSGVVGHQRVPKSYVLNSSIPLPPISEQRRIVDKLNSTVAHADACRQRLDRLSSTLQSFRLSVLAAAISGDLTTHYRRTLPVDRDAHDLLEKVRQSHRTFADSLRKRLESRPGIARRERYPLPQPLDSTRLPTLPDTWAWGSGSELVRA